MLTFDHYFMPRTLEAAFDALEQVPGARLVAGATDLLPWAREGRAGDVHLPAMVDVSRIPELSEISVTEQRVLLGAATPIAAYERDARLRRLAPVLGPCAAWFADDQIREQATIGGNIVNASPAGDSQPALLVLNARVHLARREGGKIQRREMPLSEFILGPGKTALHDREILTALTIDPIEGWGSAFEKVGHRRSLAISTVCMATAVKLDWARRNVEACRVAIGAVGPVPERLGAIEAMLVGQAPTPRLVREAAQTAADHVRSRSRQDYRREVLVNFVERALVSALSRAGLEVSRLPKEMAHA